MTMRADRIGAGTCAASVESTVVDGAGALRVPPPLVQPATRASTTASPTSARIRGAACRPPAGVLTTQIGSHHFRVAGQFTRRALQVEQPRLQHVRAVRDAQR